MRKLICALALCLAAGCSKQEGNDAPAVPQATPLPKLLVLATIAPMYCFTKNVVGDLADVEMIVPAGTSGATFQPSEDEVRRIMQADIVVENGFGFEGWMDKLVARGLKPGAVRVIAARGTGPGIPGMPGDPTSPPADAPADASGPPDPHVWLDPIMAIKELQNIRDALMAYDPANANEYLANENRYEASLRDLDDEVGRTTVDIKKRRLECEDGTFSYFLKRYEFTAVPNGNDATQGPRMADAVLVTTSTARAILNETDLPVVRADPMESGSASTEFYEQATLANARALREGLLR